MVETNHLRGGILVEVAPNRIADLVSQTVEIIGFCHDGRTHSPAMYPPSGASSTTNTSSAVTWGDTSRHAKRASNKEVFEPGTEWRSSLTTWRYTWFTTILFTDRPVSYRTHLTDTEPMSKLLALVGATLGGAVGWWLGMFIGFMTAFILSMIGTGLGVYAGRRFAAEYLL